MKVCSLHGIGDLRLEEQPLPKLERGQVTLKVMAAGICGSDLPRVYQKGTYHFPTVPGHEFAGQIVDAADAENKHLIGREAAVFPLLPCFKCGPCHLGRYAQCEDYDYYGSRRNGAFAEYLNVNVWNLVLAPDSVSYEEAAMCEPAAVAVHAMDVASPRFGDNVVISGAGPIGLVLAQLARAGGAGKVILLDVDAAKLEFAKKTGFEHVVNTAADSAAEAVNTLTGGRGAQVVIEGAGAPASLGNCLWAAANFGVVVLMGNPAKDMAMEQKAYWQILRKQLTLRGTWNSSFNGQQNDWATAIAAIASGKLDLAPLISHRFALDQCVDAFEMIRDRREFSMKVMIEPHKERKTQ